MMAGLAAIERMRSSASKQLEIEADYSSATSAGDELQVCRSPPHCTEAASDV